MNSPENEDRRRYARLNTTPEYGVRMLYQGRVLESVQLKNISACGCGIQVQIEEAPSLEMGSLIDRMYLLHPDLPFVPLQATVVYVLGKHANKTSGSVFLGVDFAPITPFMLDLINRHVVDAARGG